MSVIGDIPAELRDLCQQEGISAYGEVADPVPLLSKAAVGIAPVSEGSGVRVKILTYLSAGLPVVATSTAAEGLDFPSVFIEDDISSASARCVDILQAPSSYREAIMQTTALLKSEFLWPNIARSAANIYYSVMARERRPWPADGRMKWSQLPMWIQEVLAKGRFAERAPYPIGNAMIPVNETIAQPA